MKNSTATIVQGLGIFLLSGTLLLQSCSSDGKKESRTEDAMERTGDAASADAKEAQADAKEGMREADDKIDNQSQEVGATFRHDRDVVVANIKKRTRELDAKIDELQAKAKRNGNEAKADSKEQVDKLKDERADLNRDLEKAQNATADAWQDVKKGFRRAGDKVGDALIKAGDKMKDN